MRVLYVSGSPGKNSNTYYLLKEILSVWQDEFQLMQLIVLDKETIEEVKYVAV
jgi:hypothetical protein